MERRVLGLIKDGDHDDDRLVMADSAKSSRALSSRRYQPWRSTSYLTFAGANFFSRLASKSFRNIPCDRDPILHRIVPQQVHRIECLCLLLMLMTMGLWPWSWYHAIFHSTRMILVGWGCWHTGQLPSISCLWQHKATCAIYNHFMQKRFCPH